MPRRKRLTDAGIARLRPQAGEYTVWDTQVAGLGVRVRPSGSRTFIYHRKTDGRAKKMSFGPTMLRKVEDIRRDCMAMSVVEPKEGRHERAPLFQDFVAGAWRASCLDHCKPATRKGRFGCLKRQLIPAFGASRLDRISRIAVLRWFETFSKTAPGSANKALDLLRQILNHAIRFGHIETNPACGIRRNPGRKLTRFLSHEEIACLHRVLDRYSEGTASQAQQADIIRLLLLTGCRKSEIVRLRREEVREDRLELADSKTGPRTVLLNAPAREIVQRRIAKGRGPWVFPSVRDPARPSSREPSLWNRVRREAGIEDVRLHDLRHTVASQAALAGVSLPVVARLLGHSDVAMTIRYAHVGDREIEAAAERVGKAIDAIMQTPPVLGRRQNQETFTRQTTPTQ